MQEQTQSKVGDGRIAALYARAPEPSDHDRTTSEEQLQVCLALAQDLGYTVTEAATYSDTGPASTLTRPGLTALFGLIARQEVHAVIVYTLDRLARLETRQREVLLQELHKRNMPLYVAKVPNGYRYDPGTGNLIAEPEAGATLEDWRPPEYIVIPREDPVP